MVDQLRPAGPVEQQPRERLGWRVLSVVRELILAAGIYELYNLIQARLSGGLAHALRNGSHIWHAERMLHIDIEPALTRLFAHVPVLGVLACYWYASLHFLATVAVLVYVYRTRPDVYRNARAVLALMTLAALVVFWALPTAPPHMLPGHHFLDIQTRYESWGWWGDTALPRKAGALENPFAAMPSLHVAWALWCGVTMARLTNRRGLRLLALCYPAGTVLVVLGTANHYVADAVAAVLLWYLADRIVATVMKRSAGRRRDGLLVGRLDPGELDDSRAQHHQHHTEHDPGAGPQAQVLVVHHNADDDADHRVNRRCGRQARRQRPGLERHLIQE